MRNYLKHAITIVLMTIMVGSINAQPKKLYLAPDDHTDYIWTSTEEGYRKAFLETLDYYIRLNDSTANEPYEYQSKWNCDGSIWVFEYKKKWSVKAFTKNAINKTIEI